MGLIDKWQAKSMWVYRKPIDFRKQLNGAVQTIIDETNGPNPNSEDIDTRVFNIVPDFTGSPPSLTQNLL